MFGVVVWCLVLLFELTQAKHPLAVFLRYCWIAWENIYANFVDFCFKLLSMPLLVCFLSLFELICMCFSRHLHTTYDTCMLITSPMVFPHMITYSDGTIIQVIKIILSQGYLLSAC